MQLSLFALVQDRRRRFKLGVAAEAFSTTRFPSGVNFSTFARLSSFAAVRIMGPSSPSGRQQRSSSRARAALLPWISVMVSGPLCSSASRGREIREAQSGFLDAALCDLA